MIRFKRMPENIGQRIGPLCDFLQKEPNIIFAYLFGGFLRDRRNPLSDIDLAIYLRETKRLDYLDLFSKIANILHTDEIDLVILNDGPLSLTGRIMQSRKVLVDKKPFSRHKFESLVLRQFFDFRMKEKDIIGRRYGIG